MTLAGDNENLLMTSAWWDQTDWVTRSNAIPFETPWRTVQISDDAIGLLNSRMILNLNPQQNQRHIVAHTHEICRYLVGNASGQIHLGYVQRPRGATTEHAMELIDFAAANGLKGVLVEGWNTGWEHWIGFEDREGVCLISDPLCRL